MRPPKVAGIDRVVPVIRAICQVTAERVELGAQIVSHVFQTHVIQRRQRVTLRRKRRCQLVPPREKGKARFGVCIFHAERQAAIIQIALSRKQPVRWRDRKAAMKLTLFWHEVHRAVADRLDDRK